jgi:hypothetical protein
MSACVVGRKVKDVNIYIYIYCGVIERILSAH